MTTPSWCLASCPVQPKGVGKLGKQFLYGHGLCAWGCCHDETGKGQTQLLIQSWKQNKFVCCSIQYFRFPFIATYFSFQNISLVLGKAHMWTRVSIYFHQLPYIVNKTGYIGAYISIFLKCNQLGVKVYWIHMLGEPFSHILLNPQCMCHRFQAL